MMSRLSRLLKSRRPEIGAALGATTALWLFSVPPMQANDTGGIIAWQPGIEKYALQIADQHCSWYGKYAVITSVHAWYGDYIGFQCRRAGRWGPPRR